MLRHLALAALIVSTTLFSFAKDKDRDTFQQPGPIHVDKDGQKWVDKTLKRMTTEEKVGQLFMIWTRVTVMNEADPAWLALRDSVKKYHVGGFCMSVPVDGAVLMKNQPFEAAELLNRLQAWSDLPLIIAADFERGVSIRLYGATVFPHAMAFGAAGRLEDAEAFGRITALEARAIGVHWNFFPDADVNSNPANPIINTRSFGEDPHQVGEMVAAYIKGAHAGGMLTTVKHFPGHGDTATDSHLGVAQVTGDRARLDSVELPPFERAIQAGVDSVMVAHVSVPTLEPDSNRVATTSKLVVTDLLKDQLKFKGIVVTDALDMAGLTRMYANDIGRAAVEAFKAGNDVLLIPVDLDASVRSMVQAVKNGEIPKSRLDSSVRKILELKASLSLEKARLTDMSKLPKIIGKPENLGFGQHVADEAVTLVRDNQQVLPLQAKPTGTTGTVLPYQGVVEVHNRLVVVIFSEDLRTDSGRMLERQILARVPDAHVIYVDQRSAAGMSSDTLSAVDAAEHVIAAVYAIPTAGRAIVMAGGSKGNAAPDASTTLLSTILDHAAARTAVVAMGNPYLAQDFPSVQTYLCTFSNATVSEVAAVKAMFGEIPTHGHLPVTIPGVASRGAGLERSALGSGGSSHGKQ
ncbi:MAG TPA: glycoside hydrolase family 3 N-terminal domain-containing protein [Terriglobales bacterium]|nr:glycoside hydrolase family 3 N-terminal domain-containing protein [Terriglobales bacterium]